MTLQYQESQGAQSGQMTGQAGQFGHGQTGGMQGMGARLSDVQTPQERAAIDGIKQAIEVCEWCADQCIQHADPNMVECIRLCEDVSELGETAITLLPRRSRYASRHLQTFAQAAQACAQECSQHSHGHCQECAQVLGQTASSVQEFLGQAGQVGQGSGSGGQIGWQ